MGINSHVAWHCTRTAAAPYAVALPIAYVLGRTAKLLNTRATIAVRATPQRGLDGPLVVSHSYASMSGGA